MPEFGARFGCVAKLRLLTFVLLVIVALFTLLMPLFPESVSTPVSRCNDGHGCITVMSPFPVTASIAFRLFTIGMVSANVPCNSGVANQTDTYNFGPSCGEIYSWQW